MREQDMCLSGRTRRRILSRALNCAMCQCELGALLRGRSEFF